MANAPIRETQIANDRDACETYCGCIDVTFSVERCFTSSFVPEIIGSHYSLAKFWAIGVFDFRAHDAIHREISLGYQL